MGKIKKTKKVKKAKPEIRPDHVIGWDTLHVDSVVNSLESQISVPRDARLLSYAKAVRQEARHNAILLKLQAERSAELIFDSLYSVKNSIVSGKIEDQRLKTRIDVNQDALERSDIEIRKVTQSLYNTGLKTAQNSEAVMALTSRVKNLSQEVDTLRNYLIFTSILSIVSSIVSVLIALTK